MRVVKMRADYRVDSAAPIENSPQLMAFTTVALGGFSSLVADILWLRVSTLQQEGRFFELVQLADWITKLEPRCGEIWEFHAWNMAYNVSVMMPDPEDRWRWVKNGVELLRDEGIRYNAGDSKVYWELGWLFLNKIGGNLDQAHLFYKTKWAEEMTSLFGGGYPDYDKLSLQPDKLGKMTGEYKLKLEVMRRIDWDYGPIDWRIPESHAVYWGICGREHGGSDRALPCERMILQSLRRLFAHGRLTITKDGQFIQEPAIDLFLKIVKAFESAQGRYPKENTIEVSYVAFLTEAVRTLYTNGQKAKAREVFNNLAEKYPSPETAQGFETFVEKGGK
jgi:hypothetical protein